MAEDNPDTPAAAAVAMKAPTFCSQDPAMWFSILECSFKASRTTNSLTKFTTAASLLPPDVLTQVSDVVISAHTSESPYEDLKAALLNRLQSSVATRLRELLSKEELGAEKPSDLLRRMKQLLGDKHKAFDKDLFKQLFYQRLPPTIQRGLFTVKDKLTPEELASLADDFTATLPSEHASPVAAITTQADLQVTRLAELISQLTVEVGNLKKELHTRTHQRSSTPHRYRPRSRSRSTSKGSNKDICYYHRRFGEEASKCTTPCSFKASNTKGEH